MSILIDGAGEHLIRSTSPPTYNNSTICLWARRTAENASSWRNFILWEAGANYVALGFNTSNQMLLNTNGGNNVFSAALPVGAWGFMYLRATEVSGDSWEAGCAKYPSTTFDIALVNDTGVSMSPSLYIGNWSGGDEEVPADFAYMKIWNAILTRDEIRAEMFSVLPCRKRNLYGYYPLLTGNDARDYSGMGNHFTIGATPTTSPPPPIGVFPRSLILPEYHWESSATDWCEFQLSSVTDPNTDSGYVVHVRRYKSGSATIKHVYALVDGSTIIQEWEDNDVPTGISQLDLPVTNAAAITSHSNLRGRVRAIKVS